MNKTREKFKEVYLAKDSPLERSGFSHSRKSFERLRRPIASIMETCQGSFLDLGCANGVLIDYLQGELTKNFSYTGVDFVPELVQEAKKNVKASFQVADIMNFVSSQRWDVVRFEPCYAKGSRVKLLIEHVLENFLAEDGVAIACNYSENHPEEERTVLDGFPAIKDLKSYLDELGYLDSQIYYSRCSEINRECSYAVLGKSQCQWLVREVGAEAVRSMRHKVLRPHQDRRECCYPFDESAASFHLEVIADSKQLAVLSALCEEGVYRLRGMAVDEEYRSQGIGRLLLLSMKRKLLERGVSNIWCNGRKGAMKFYSSLGWEVTRGPFEIEGIGTHWRLHWDLNS